MTWPLRIAADDIALPVPAGNDLMRARTLCLRDRFAEAEGIVAVHVLAGGRNKAIDPQPLVSFVDVVVQYCWCLFRQKKFDRLSALFDDLGSEILAAFPQLGLIRVRQQIQQGEMELALVACESFHVANVDGIRPIFAEFLFARGLACWELGMAAEALRFFEESHALFSIFENEGAQAETCNSLGIVYSRMGDPHESLKWYRRALASFVRLKLPRKQSMALLNMGVSLYKIADYASAAESVRESLNLGRKFNLPHRQCFANIALGNVHRLTRDFEAARRHLHTAYNQAQELQFPREEALALEFLGDVYRDEGQTETARRFYARAMAIGLRIAPEGDVVMELRRRNGECLGLEDRPGEAMAELQQALDMSRAQKDRFEEGVTLRVMAEVALRTHDLAAARRFVDKGAAVLLEIGARHEAAIALLRSVEVRLAEVESGRPAMPVGQLLELAWRQATEALDLFLRVDVRWWTDRCRDVVARVSAMRSAQGRHGPAGGETARYEPGDVVVHASTAMRDLMQLCDMFAGCADPVLITGETGTGKEVLATRLHRHSARADGPLVVVNVAAIPQTMFEREFFGHTRGAFSGAERDAGGFAAQADGGTLFLDEIGELPLEVQPKLLRLLQEGTYQAIGDPRARRTDVRLIAATNANLGRMVSEGRFRADLYYRLRTLELDIPPLRERPEDVLPLLRHFLSLAAGRPIDLAEYFNRRSLAELARHAWPGNAREVAIVARRAHLALSSQGRVLVAVGRDDGTSLLADGPGDAPGPGSAEAPAGLSAGEAAERTRILLAIEENGGSRRLAARALGLGRSTLYRRMARLGIATRRG